MNSLLRFLLILCALTTTTRTTAYGHSDADKEDIVEPTPVAGSVDSSEQDTREAVLLSHEEEEGRHLADSYEVSDDYAKQDHHAAFRRRAKPLKNIFMGIYKNYKSTYLGNKTSLEYKKKLRDHKHKADVLQNDTPSNAEVDDLKSTEVPEQDRQTYQLDQTDEQDEPREATSEYSVIIGGDSPSGSKVDATTESNLAIEDTSPEVSTALIQNEALRRKHRKRKRKYRISSRPAEKRKRFKASPPPAGGDDPLVHVHENAYRYNVGAGVNMTLDMDNDIVNVNLDGKNLQEIMRGRWLSDNTERGRGKKYDMITKILPLFVLPFLIQSAIVPFLVMKLKLLLVKSILVGKLAIFLLIVSAFKNNSKSMQSYEVAPSYWAGEPSRSSELAAAASSSAYNGYRVEGKPAAWIN